MVAGAIALVAMVAISLYGAVTLPPGSQVPVHHGIGGYSNWQPKALALIIYPAIGVFVYAITLAATSSAHSNGKVTPVWIAPIAIVVIAISEYAAIRAAARRSGS